jgi:hypothetical protein
LGLFPTKRFFSDTVLLVAKMAACLPRLFRVVILLPAVLSAQKAEIVGGNVVFVDSQGLRHQKTKLGVDADANLAPDNTFIVFARQAHTLTPDTHVRVIKESEIWMVSTTEGSEPQRLYARSSRDPEWKHILTSPKVSLDSKSVYFMSDFSATSGALWRLDLVTRKAKMLIAGAVDYGIIPSGSRSGQLIVQQRSTCTEPLAEEKFSHACYPFFLFTSEGRSLRRVADDGSDLKALLRLYAESRRQMRHNRGRSRTGPIAFDGRKGDGRKGDRRIFL